MEFYDSVTNAEQMKVEDSRMPIPADSTKATALRQELFKLRDHRQSVLRIIKDATILQSLLARNLREGILSQDHSITKDKLAAVGKLLSSCHAQLQNSDPVACGIDILDHLLSHAKGDKRYGRLFELPESRAPTHTRAESEKSSDEDGDDDDDEAKKSDQPAKPETPADIRAAIGVLYNLQSTFVGGRQFADGVDRVVRVEMKSKKAKAKNKETITVDKVDIPPPTKSEVNKADKACATWMKTLSGGIDEKRFQLNFKYFEETIARDDALGSRLTKLHKKSGKSQNSSDFMYELNRPQEWLQMVRDNLYHVRRFMHNAVANHLVRNPSVDHEGINQCLRRMYALVSVVYGCFPEASLWLTVMDELLEQLAAYFLGHVERFSTTSLSGKAKEGGDEAFDDVDGVDNVDEEEKAKIIAGLEREHEARRLFAELARFYRGAVLLGYSTASRTKSFEATGERER